MLDIQNHNKHKGTYHKTNLKTRKLLLDTIKTLHQAMCISWCTAISIFCMYVIQNCRYIKPNTAASSTEYIRENAHTWNLWLARLCNNCNKLTEWSKKGVYSDLLIHFSNNLKNYLSQKSHVNSKYRKFTALEQEDFMPLKPQGQTGNKP